MPEAWDRADDFDPLPETSSSKLVRPGRPLNSPRPPSERPPLEHPEHGAIGDPFYPPPPPPNRPPAWILAAIPILLLVVIGLAVLVLTGGDDAGLDTAQGAEDPAASGDEGAATDDATDDGATDPALDTDAGTDTDASADAPTALPAPVAPYLMASLADGQLQLSGVLPSDDLKFGIDQTLAVAYTPSFSSATTVDATVAPEPWLEQAPTAVVLLQGLIDGNMLVSEGTIYLEGRASDQASLDETLGFLTTFTGMPVSSDGVEVANLREAIYVLASSEGDLVLSGALPTEEIRAGIVTAAQQIYGPERIVDASTVDADVAPALWMYNPQGLIAVLSQFPDFEIRLDGGAFDATLAGSETFEPGSAEFTPALTQVLNFGVITMLRDPSISIVIEGHTDDQGEEAFNLDLSQQRADAVAAYMEAGGIAPERITAIGKGETEPVADNSTPEGRGRNRRVEFSLNSP